MIHFEHVSGGNLRDVSLTIEDGEFVAVVGKNGAGKSTLCKHINGLLQPTSGRVTVDGLDTVNDGRKVRERVGYVFQNPENALVCAVVEDDVAFGLENLGLNPELIRKRVDAALHAVNMYERRQSLTSRLSGGQQQRVAIAGVLAMSPKHLIFDEPTSMLDTNNQREVIDIMQTQHAQGKTIILVTHTPTEVALATRIIELKDGRLC